MKFLLVRIHIILLGLCGFIFALTSGRALADENGLYRIEVLAFRYLDSGQLEGEQWLENPGYPRFDKAIKLIPSSSEASINFGGFGIADQSEMEQDTVSSNPFQNEVAEPQTFALGQDKSLSTRQLEREEKQGSVGTDVDPVGTEDVTRSPVYWVPFQSLEKEQMDIASMWDRLSNSEKYSPMLLQGWVQSIEAPDRSRAVYLGEIKTTEPEQPGLENGRDFLPVQEPEIEPKPETIELNNTGSRQGIGSEMTALLEGSNALAANTGSDRPDIPDVDAVVSSDTLLESESDLQDDASSETVLKDQPKIEGILRASKSNYFHLDIDLALTLPVEDSAEVSSFYIDDDWKRVFRLFESRRIKIGEINYFDHPAFGVLVKVVDLSEDNQGEVTR